ncbi:MAG: hypothetical protein HYZ53_26295 [Planctomycetes bacterium]|nr:hypothetical protein [Planctomycetota bacterium]
MRFRYRLLLVLCPWVVAPALAWIDPWAAAAGLAAAGLASAAFAVGEYREFCPAAELRLRAHATEDARYPISSRGLWGLDPDSPAARIELVEGVPRVLYPGIGPRWNPAYVAWWGILCHDRAAETGEARFRDAFARQLAWLGANARECFGTGRVWSYEFDWPNGPSTLRAPWISAMAQGLAISALVRGARLFGDPSFLALARAAAEPFRHDLDAGGVRTTLNGSVFYEEYPIRPETLVLDGSLFALVGLGELAQVTGDASIEELFRSGAAGVAANLPLWDFAGRWTRYGRFGTLAGADYHLLAALLAQVVGRRSGERVLEARGKAWEAGARSPWLRAAAVLANRWVRLGPAQ